ncbi:MAG: hypothetical protein JXQ23_03765 [Clostridia bacterium]|nr:hypothetical protein [Clostridia bacterium]
MKKKTVIIIIFILTLLLSSCATAQPVYDKAKDDSKTTVDTLNVSVIDSAISMYTSVTGLQPDDGDITINSILLKDGYLREVPSDPWGEGRVYRIENGKAKILGSP